MTRSLTALALAALLASPVSGQTPGPGSTSTGWLSPEAGLRFGYDDGSNGSLVGAQLRIPVLPDGRVELVPSGDIVFLTGLKEYQGNLDLVYVLGDRGGGLYAGGGLAWRNSIFSPPDRETRRGASIALGLLSRGMGAVPIGTQIEIRWIFIDADFDPRTVSLGANLPLWGWGARDNSRE